MLDVAIKMRFVLVCRERVPAGDKALVAKMIKKEEQTTSNASESHEIEELSFIKTSKLPGQKNHVNISFSFKNLVFFPFQHLKKFQTSLDI